MNEKNKRMLMNAVICGSYKQIKYVFNTHFVDFDENYFDYNLLLAAFRRNEDNIISFLLRETTCRAGNPIRVRPEETPLHIFVKSNRKCFVELLLRKGAFIFDKDENGEIPLLAAFKNKKLVAVKALLTHSRPNCNPDDNDAILYFHIACATNHVSAAEHFLKCGVNPNIPFSLEFEEYFGLNPVHFAAEKNYSSLFQLLVQHRADLSKKNFKGLTPLHVFYYANSSSGKTRIIQTFESENHTKFINAEDSNRVSHLHISCMIDNPHNVQVFIANGADLNSSISPDCTIYPGFTPLHIAITNQCDKVVELLLQSGADSNKKNKEGKTPLHLACTLPVNKTVTDRKPVTKTKTKNIYDRKHVIKMLLDFKASPDIPDEQGNTPLHMAFYENVDTKSIFDMVSKISGKINFTNDEGLSYFHIACTTNNINKVKDCLESGVNVDNCVPSGDYSGYTALHFAALRNQKDVVKLLLEKNAQVNIKTQEFQATALHLACEFNYAKFCGENLSEKIELFPLNLDSISNRTNQLDIISLLLSHGAHVNAKDYQGITPLLHMCMIDKHYCKLNWSHSFYTLRVQREFNKEISIRIKEVVEMLVSSKAEINVDSKGQKSILHIISEYAGLENTEELIKFILTSTKGIDIDTVDDAGLTPLHVAVKASNFRMVKVLVNNKANVNIKCKNSKIPLHGLFCAQPWSPVKYVIDKDERKIFNILLNNGSDVDILVGEKCKTLLRAAIERRHNFMVNKLLSNYVDINMEDSLDSSCISSLFEWKSIQPDDHKLQTEFAFVFQTVYVHVQKLIALGHHVSEKVWKCCLELYSLHKAVFLKSNNKNLINLDNVYNNCKKELEELKTRKIDNDTSFYSILLKDEHELLKYVWNDNFMEIIDDKIKNDFPLYHELLELQFKRGSERSALLPTAKEVLNSLIHTCNIKLPHSCCDMIVKNLKNKDLANLKVAVPPKRSLKRKLNDTESITFVSSKQKRKVEESKDIQETK